MYLIVAKIWGPGKKKWMHVGVAKTLSTAQRIMIDKALFMLEVRGMLHKLPSGDTVILYTEPLGHDILTDRLIPGREFEKMSELKMAVEDKIVCHLGEEGFVVKIKEVDDYSSYDAQVVKKTWSERLMLKLKLKQDKIAKMKQRLIKM